MKLILLKTVRDLRASLAQSIALIVIVMLGVASFAATVAAYRGLDTPTTAPTTICSLRM